MISDADAFMEARQEWRSIRVNTLKIDRDELMERLQERYEIKEMPWYENGLFIKGENISKNMEYYLGYYHIQEAASMIPPLLLNPEKNEIVIDLCAAPGSKTTQMAMMMENYGIIIANDSNPIRLKALTHNIQRAMATNCIVTNYDGRYMDKTGIKADKILLDAPCTASGKVIKDKKLLERWNYGRIRKMSALQKSLIRAACNLLEEDGILVYSTCSIEPEENEDVIDYAIKKFDMEVEKASLKGIKTREGIKEWDGKEYEWASKAIRIWPQDNSTEGFFICRLRKC